MTPAASNAKDRSDETVQVEIRLLGPMEVLIAGQPATGFRSRRTRWLLGLLALRANCEVERRWLAGTLWPDKFEEKALGNLRWTLNDLRRALGSAAGIIGSPSARSLRLDAERAVI